MSTDFRALCEELSEALCGHEVTREDAALILRARAALAAEPDGPAVPEGREPASVVGEPSDENCWQWYTYCPEEGLEMYSDRKQAQSAAQSIMGSYEVAAYSDGWHEDMESVSWGMLVPVEQAQVVECKAAEPDDEFDEWVKYELRPACYGHHPAPPAAGEQRHPTPVPVSEHPWKRDRWCDDEDRCWCFNQWDLQWELENYTTGAHWCDWMLPFTALPLPQGEVES